ncbi:NADPH:quinone oxidoreductase family protein [Tistrella mobilis]
MLRWEGTALGRVEDFAPVERPLPEPGPGQMRLRIEAAALGYVDGLIVHGRYQIRPDLPYVPGGEIAGIVEATGPGVTRYVPGDRVVTWQMGGGLATHIVVAGDEADPVPDGLSGVHAAAMLVDYQTAAYGLFPRGGLKPGERVLVTGASGGVGSAAVQLAARAGAHVVALASTEEGRARAIASGAAAAIPSLDPDIRARIRETLPGGAIDIVFDPVAGPGFEPLFRSLDKEGRHLILGFVGGPIPALPVNLPLLKSAALIGVEIRHYLTAHADEARAVRLALMARVAAGELMPPKVVAMPLDQAREALAATLSRSKGGKIVVVPGVVGSAVVGSDVLGPG